ncbi:DNA primase large subunit [Phlebotomus argentipes]|uniref:DNA primase large subunit n=1 Tax=Phlebotomus argentipes TaxID=94469 RepID=UPI0028933150|nr:DNA primase large subunit [Phlebotomus argentipes]
MDFQKKPRRLVEIHPEVENLESLYPTNVSMYRLPPTSEVSIQEFEEMVLDRLRLLRILELSSLKEFKSHSQEWRNFVMTELNVAGLKGYVKLIQGGSGQKESVLQARRRDYISHFLLRLAYCRSQDLRKWFMARETELFKLKFSHLSPDGVAEVLKVHNLHYYEVSAKEKDHFKASIAACTFYGSVSSVENGKYFKVPFTSVPDLFNTGRCYLHRGAAFVSALDIGSVVATDFKKVLEDGLMAVAEITSEVDNDERVYNIIRNLHKSYIGKDYATGAAGNVSIHQIDDLSKKSFPLCMRVMHEHLRSTHTMKHDGRLQYGLFLKAIGMTLEDALRFWEDEFTRVITAEAFQKNYRYNIRYNYGKEGSRRNFTAYGCSKIMNTLPIAPQVHGCPFRNLKESRLREKLLSYGVSRSHTEEITGIARSGNFQEACKRYFEISHDVQLAMSFSHPNKYFEDSQNIIRSRKQGKSEPVKVKTEAEKLMDDDEKLWEDPSKEAEVNLPDPLMTQTQDLAALSMDWDATF